MDVKVFYIYKGVQKPLVYKFFKGKFIYYGLGSILIGLLGTMIVSAAINMWAGILPIVFITLPGLAYTATQQKKGLHSKVKGYGIYFLKSTYHRNGKRQGI